MFAERTKQLKGSFIREILALTQQPGIISFAGGLPDPALFPAAALQEAAMAIHRNGEEKLYQYGESAGDRDLRRWIAEHWVDSGDQAPDVIITTGSQQALDLTARCLLNPGDGVAIEASYLGAIQLFNANQATLHPVPTDDDGPDLEVLEVLFRLKKIRWFYAIPDFQNPRGTSYSLERRHGLVELAERYGAWILEDAPYSALRYRGEALPSLQSLLPRQVIHFGSFSKIIAPGLRLGWVSAPEIIRKEIVKMKQAADLHSSSYDQQLILAFLRSGALPDHLQQLKQSYRQRLQVMTNNLDQQLGHRIKRTDPSGGMFVWVEMEQGMDATALLQQAIKQGVAFVPGEAFYSSGGGKNCLRLNFTNSEPVQITEGIRRLSEMILNSCTYSGD